MEGFGYEETLDEVKKLYPAETDNMDDDDERVLPISAPKPIREMADSKNAIKALGNMIWSDLIILLSILGLTVLLSGIFVNSTLTRES